MTDKYIYLAVAYGGEWEDAWQTNLAASFDRTLVEQFITTKKSEDEEHDRVFALYREFVDQYSSANPMPEYQRDTDYPRWGAGLGAHEITDKMREERNKVIRQNQLIAEANSKAYEEWRQKLKRHTESFLQH